MKRTCVLFLSICQVVLLFATGVKAQVVVFVEWPEGSATVAPEPRATLRGSDASLEGEASSNRWTFRVPSPGGRLFTAVLLQLSPDPQDLHFDPVELQVPFTESDEVTTVFLAPYRLEPGSAPVREIYGTPVERLSQERLTAFYQKAKTVAENRMATLSGWADLHDYDVQAVFQYLRASWELTNRTYVIPPGDIARARDWLNEAIERQPARVDKAVTLGHARDVVALTDAAEAVRFGRLWEIVRVWDVDGRYDLLKQYLQLVREVPTAERRARIVRGTVPVGIILSSMAEAIVHVAKRHPELEGDTRQELEFVLQGLRNELPTTTGDLHTRLLSDITTVREFLEASRP